MEKSVFIAEKPSVAKEFAKALKENFTSKDGYMESNHYIVTWCVGHLVTMSYPESYSEDLKRWSMDTLPFIPKEFKYEVISSVKKQFNIVKEQLTRDDVVTIFVCTDSGREGEYIYRLVRNEIGVSGKNEKRVWIDSQTEEEILKGIKNAKNISDYDNLSAAAYLRAKEDYLMGINFSRAMTLQYGYTIKEALGRDRAVLAMGRVMTCVLGMIVKREREIRAFIPTPFYKIIATSSYNFDLEWKLSEKSSFSTSNQLYKDNGFLNKEDALDLVDKLSKCNQSQENNEELEATIESVTRKKEKVNPPLLYNLAELQNDCAKIFKISPDETLKIAQELYEKKLTTYPRTDARVISTAVAKEIHKNISGLSKYPLLADFVKEILESTSFKSIEKSRYCDDKKITDHYAIIPTGFGLTALSSLSDKSKKVYELIARRFLSIFYPPAIYSKTAIIANMKAESETIENFIANFKVLADEGYLKVSKASFIKKKKEEGQVPDVVNSLKKGNTIPIKELSIKESETSPPKRYNSGSIILAMENAGQLIEDEELRAQIKGSGIGTSATRAEILKKLNSIDYIKTNKKTQILTPTIFGEAIFDATSISLPYLLSPELTASWEKGLTYVQEGSIDSDEYLNKLEDFVSRRTNGIKVKADKNGLFQRIKALKSVYN